MHTAPGLLLALGLAAAGPAAAESVLSADLQGGIAGLLVPGQPARITLTGNGPDPAQPLPLTLSNERGEAIGSLSAQPDPAGGWSAALPTGEIGYVEVSLAASAGARIAARGSHPDGSISYAVVPDPETRPVMDAMHQHVGFQGGIGPQVVGALPLLGFAWSPNNELNWGALEPDHPGQYDPADPKPWPLFAGRFAHLGSASHQWPVHVVVDINTKMPAWAIRDGSRGTQGSPFGALKDDATEQAYSAFLAKLAPVVASHLGDQPHVYEVAWEPAARWRFQGTPEELVTLHRLAAEALHKADPAALVIGPCLYVNKVQVEIEQRHALWAAGLSRWLDGLSMHAYAPWPAEPSGFIAALRQERKDAARPDGSLLPLWSTEQGLQSIATKKDGAGTPYNQALGDTRLALILLGEGAQLTTQFYFDDYEGNTGRYGLFFNLDKNERNGAATLSPKPAAATLAVMTHLVDGAEALGAVQNLPEGVIGYRFRRDRSERVVLWAIDDQPHRLRLRAGGLTLTDWLERPMETSAPVIVGAEPVYAIADGPITLQAAP